MFDMKNLLDGNIYVFIFLELQKHREHTKENVSETS